MYARYTSFRFDTDDLAGVEQFWNEIGAPVVARQSGFRGGFVFRSLDQPDSIRALTLWGSQQSYTALEDGPDQALIGQGIKSTSMATTERDGMEAMSVVRPAVGEVRIIRSSIQPGAVDALEADWPRARAMIESAPGCVEASGFIDPDEMIFVLVVRWRSAEDAESFRQSPEHNEGFVPIVERHVTRLDRLRTRPIGGN
jgi:heme-degrading monooxygenase HmoA